MQHGHSEPLAKQARDALVDMACAWGLAVVGIQHMDC
jgi:hypothetical protein